MEQVDQLIAAKLAQIAKDSAATQAAAAAPVMVECANCMAMTNSGVKSCSRCEMDPLRMATQAEREVLRERKRIGRLGQPPLAAVMAPAQAQTRNESSAPLINLSHYKNMTGI